MSVYLEFLRKSLKQVEAEFEFSASIDHNGLKGVFREYIIKKILRPFLPDIYGISSGQAFDKNDKISRQLDIVLYDKLYSYTVPFTKDFSYFPAESIYGAIEIKSSLDKNSFTDALENIESIKTLCKDNIDGYYINPYNRLDIKNVTWDIQVPKNTYLGIIFAYESVEVDTVIKYIEEEINNIGYEYMPNLIVLLNKKTIIYRYKTNDDGTYSIELSKDYNGFMAIRYDDEILSAFIISLLIALRNIYLKAMKIEELFEAINHNCIGPLNHSIPHLSFTVEKK